VARPYDHSNRSAERQAAPEGLCSMVRMEGFIIQITYISVEVQMCALLLIIVRLWTTLCFHICDAE